MRSYISVVSRGNPYSIPGQNGTKTIPFGAAHIPKWLILGSTPLPPRAGHYVKSFSCLNQLWGSDVARSG